MFDYIFRRGNPDDAQRLYNIVVDRMAWMDRKGIRQWNVTEYLERFPLEYYIEKQRIGELYVLEESREHASGLLDGQDARNPKEVCAAVLKQEDDRWPDDGEPSLYLHNFASVVGYQTRVGDIFLKHCENLAREMGKRYMRLDCAIDNAFLNRYYSERGYSEAGFCTHGLYKGVLRQKEISPLSSAPAPRF